MLNPGALEAQLRSLGIRNLEGSKAPRRVLSGGNLQPRCKGELRTGFGGGGPDVYPSHRLDFQGLLGFAAPPRGVFRRLP